MKGKTYPQKPLAYDGPAPTKSTAKEAPLTIETSSNANLQMAQMLTRRLAVVLDTLQWTGEGSDGNKAESAPTGILGTLDRTGTDLSEAVRLLYNIESVIGISAVAAGR